MEVADHVRALHNPREGCHDELPDAIVLLIDVAGLMARCLMRDALSLGITVQGAVVVLVPSVAVLPWRGN